ncbi:C6 finger domain [Mycena sanguinolenta]|uniref:C6 finger domain n=1 Tax=Mycena sanguinolenta TaxID=230812 RepID=A0A8H6Y3F2_9AGAR|nr:C6 finger domain [Mycena sanguinolenta]
MSTSKSTAHPHLSNAPFAQQRRRTIMACVNCRKRKMRCITTEQPPKNPCARCTKKGLPCEYVAADNDEDNQSPDPGFSTSQENSRGRPPMQPQSSGTAPPMPTLPLPYTMPPASEQTSTLFWN